MQEPHGRPFFPCMSANTSDFLRGPSRSFFRRATILALAAIAASWLAVPAAAHARITASFHQQQEQPAASAAAPAPGERQAGRLELGKPVERDLQGGQTDVFTIELSAGQFLHVVAEQKGIAVVLQVVGPDGKTILESNNVNGAWGPEPASLIAGASGTFLVRIECVKTAGPGKYEIAVTDLRPPKPGAEKLVAAERAFVRAVRLFNQQGEKALPEGNALLEKALPLWRELGDRYEEAMVLFVFGRAKNAFGDSQKALEYYNQAQAVLHAVGDRAGEAMALNNIGKLYDDAGAKQKALDYYNQALPLRRVAGDRYGESITLTNIGSVYDDI